MTTPNLDDAAWPCSVCGEPAGPQNRSDCYRCGAYFHLRLTTTSDGPDCGDVWIDDEVMALQFACRTCLDEQLSDARPPESPTPSPPESVESPSRARRAPAGSSARDLARRRR